MSQKLPRIRGKEVSPKKRSFQINLAYYLSDGKASNTGADGKQWGKNNQEKICNSNANGERVVQN